MSETAKKMWPQKLMILFRFLSILLYFKECTAVYSPAIRFGTNKGDSSTIPPNPGLPPGKMTSNIYWGKHMTLLSTLHNTIFTTLSSEKDYSTYRLSHNFLNLQNITLKFLRFRTVAISFEYAY